jgi:hypothetical protein
MFEKISRITLDILLDIINQIKLHSHEFESLDSEEYKRSDLREVLKEEYLRVVFYEKIKNSIINSFSASNRDLIRWIKVIADKEYVKDPRKKCDLYLEGEIIQKKGQFLIYDQDIKKRAWIELKFFTPTNDAPAINSVNFVKDILRVLFLSNDLAGSDRFVIVLILCGKYKEKSKNILKYFLKNKFFKILFSPTELNPAQDFVINFKEILPECNKSSIFRERIAPLEKVFSKIDFDLIYFRRMIISPFQFFKENIPIEKYNKKLFGYVFKIKGYRSVKS